MLVTVGVTVKTNETTAESHGYGVAVRVVELADEGWVAQEIVLRSSH